MFHVIRAGRALRQGPVRIASYSRVSTEQDDQKNSLASQLKYFDDVVGAAPGLELCQAYFDEGISGTSLKKRASFNRMLADARAGKLDVIVTKEVSRFARNTVDVLELTRELRTLGVQVIFLNDGINTFDADGELRLTIMASLAQEESRKTSERVKWGQARRMEQGVVFGRSMLGYDVKGGKMKINPEGAMVVRLIFEKYLYGGLGAFRIARELEEAGIPTYHRQGRWTPKVIYEVLCNEKYIGDLEQKKTYTPNYLNHEKKYNRGTEERIYIKNHHEPIIDRVLWNAVQAERLRRSALAAQERTGKHSGAYWCSGKLVCALCGSRLMRRTKKLASGGVRCTWLCGEAVRFGTRKTGEGGRAIGCNAAAVDERVLKHCVRHCIRQVPFSGERLAKEIVAELRAVQAQQSPYRTDRLERNMERQKQKMKNAVELRAEGEITAEDFRLLREGCAREITRLQEQLQRAAEFDREQERQATQPGQCAKRVRELLRCEDDGIGDEAFLGKLLEYLRILEENEVEVKLIGVPEVFRLRYTTSGRGESYGVRVFD